MEVEKKVPRLSEGGRERWEGRRQEKVSEEEGRAIMPPSAAEHEVRRGKIAPLDYFHWKLQKKHPYPQEGVDEDGLVKQREWQIRRA